MPLPASPWHRPRPSPSAYIVQYVARIYARRGARRTRCGPDHRRPSAVEYLDVTSPPRGLGRQQPTSHSQALTRREIPRRAPLSSRRLRHASVRRFACSRPPPPLSTLHCARRGDEWVPAEDRRTLKITSSRRVRRRRPGVGRRQAGTPASGKATRSLAPQCPAPSRLPGGLSVRDGRGSWRGARARRGPRTPAATPSTPTLPVMSGAPGSALRDVAERGGELLRGVAEHELEVQLLVDAEHRLDRVGLHAHADHDDARAARGAAAMIWSSTPGTPTHSKTTAGRSAGPDPGRQHRRRAASANAASRQLCHGVVSAGSTTTSAPIATASSRRRGEKSAATIGPRAVQAQRRDHGEADRTAADHQRRVVGLEPRLGHRVEARPPSAR